MSSTPRPGLVGTMIAPRSKLQRFRHKFATPRSVYHHGLEDTEIGDRRRKMQRHRVHDRTGRIVRRDRQQSRVGEAGDLLRLQHAARVTHIGLENVDRPLRDRLEEALGLEEPFASRNRHWRAAPSHPLAHRSIRAASAPPSRRCRSAASARAIAMAVGTLRRPWTSIMRSTSCPTASRTASTLAIVALALSAVHFEPDRAERIPFQRTEA